VTHPRANATGLSSASQKLIAVMAADNTPLTILTASQHLGSKGRGALIALRECEAAGLLTYDQKANQWNCTKPGGQVKTKAQRYREWLKDRARKVTTQGTQTTPVTLKLGDELQRSKAYAMALAYEEILGIYLGRPALNYLKSSFDAKSKNFDLWLRAALHAEQLLVNYETYVKAQFWCFDQWFSRAPKPYELSSYKTKIPSNERVRLYLNAIQKGSVDPNTKIMNRAAVGGPLMAKTSGAPGHKITTYAHRVAPQISASVRFDLSAQCLRQLMKNYGATEEQILKAFAKGPQAALYFSKEFLDQNPTYQALLAAGEV
jgi:hypothetical protein